MAYPVSSISEVVDNIVTSTFQSIRRKVADNIFNKYPLQAWMRRRGKIKPYSGSRRIDVNLRYAKNTATWFGKGEAVSASELQELTTARYSWSDVAAPMLRTLQDDLENSGQYQIVDYVESLIDNTTMTIEEALETQLFAGASSSGKEMEGLQLLAADDPTTSTTIGQINQSTQSWWQNVATNLTGESVATFWEARAETMYNNVSKIAGNGTNPDIIVTGQTAFEYVKGALAPYLRGTKEELADMGFENLTFRGTPIVWSPSCGARMYFLNTEHLWMAYDPRAFFQMTKWKETEDQVETRQAQIYCRVQLVTNRRRALGVIYNIDTR